MLFLGRRPFDPPETDVLEQTVVLVNVHPDTPFIPPPLAEDPPLDPVGPATPAPPPPPATPRPADRTLELPQSSGSYAAEVGPPAARVPIRRRRA